MIDDKPEHSSASPVQYAVLFRDQDSALPEEPSPSPQLCFVPPPPASSRFEEEEEAEEELREELREANLTPTPKRKWSKQRPMENAARKRARPLRKKPAPSAIVAVEPAEVEQTQDVQCTLCKAYTFDLKSHLKLHCSVCNVAFKDFESLNEHKRVHVTASSHCSCGICGMKFASSEQLRGHLQINGYHRNLIPTTPGSKKTSVTVASSSSAPVSSSSSVFPYPACP